MPLQLTTVTGRAGALEGFCCVYADLSDTEESATATAPRPTVERHPRMTTPPFSDRVNDLLSLFNRQTVDLPDGLVHNDCIFRLNGLAYHEHLGRPVTDPIVRLIGCGPAGYRFLLTGLRYAIREPHLSVDRTDVATRADGSQVVSVRGTLTGTLRGETKSSAAACEVSVRASGDGWVHEIAVLMGDADVERLRNARQS